MKCYKCENNFADFQQYFVHLRYVHNVTNYFTCPDDNCNRLYHSKSDFKKHLINYHNYNKLNTRDSKSSKEVCSSNSDDPINLNESTKFESSGKKQHSFLIDYQLKVNAAVVSFIAKLYNVSNLPKSIIQFIIELVSELFISEPFCMLKHIITDLNKDCVQMLSILQNSFKDFDSDYKRMNYFKQLCTYVKPVPKRIAVSDESQRKNGTVEMVLKTKYLYFIPLRENLKQFLEVSGVLEIITNYQKEVYEDKHVLRNIVNGTSWQHTLQNGKEETVIPLTIYFDDFESGNPLGSHAGNQKIGAVYVTICTIPPELSSRLDNVLLALLFYAHDRTTFGNEVIFRPLLEELNFLKEHGICIKSDRSVVSVKFCIANISGDNLGLHSILGFHESFSSNNFCRFCTTSKEDTKTDTKERPENIRRDVDYNAHCDNNLGIKEKCIWHVLDNFHVYNNFTCDVMHDLCEGVHRYDMCLIIKHFINNKYFNLNNLNSRIKYFAYMKSEKNRPPPVTKQNLVNGKIMISASEMLCLVRNLRYIIGDLIAEGDPVWNLYLSLFEITEILTSQLFTSEILDYLKNLIESYLENLIHLFNCCLKPKHHFLLHYPMIIKKVGPPILISAFKFEAKHKELKKIAQSIACRKNLPLTLSTRHQIINSQRFVNNTGFTTHYKHGKILKLNDILDMESDYICVDFVEVNGVTYCNKNVILYKYENDEPSFLKIERIFFNVEITKLYFSCKVLKTVTYSPHYMAYVVTDTLNTKFINLQTCYSTTPSAIRKIDRNQYVDLKS